MLGGILKKENMWTRLLIKCNNCDKVTNLRLQIPERKILPVSFNCLNCETLLKGTLTVDFKNISYDFKVEKGSLIGGDPYSGDYFCEFSDTLATNRPSSKPHNIVMPTLRIPTKDFDRLKITKDLRKMHENSVWDDFKDLIGAYSRFDKPIIEKLVKNIIGHLYSEEHFIYRIDLDYHRNYFLSLNFIIYPWIDFESHSAFCKWLDKKIFNENNKENQDLLKYVNDVMTDNYCDTLRKEIGELTSRFADLKDFFFYANHELLTLDNFAGIQDFTILKNFYTDCFEFLGRTSHLVFRLQNFHERGTQNTVPVECKNTVPDAVSFDRLNHGDKLRILNLSKESELKLLYEKSFNSKLRNGINHYNAKIDNRTQIISYYPNHKNPHKEYQIKYIDFLNLSLNSFNSVLKIGQLLKFGIFYKYNLQKV